MNLFKKILNIKKFDFFPPKKNKILFIGSHNVDLFEKNILKNCHTICEIENLNLYILLISLFKKYSDSLIINYYIHFIKKTNPNIVITFIDNYHNFYLLKNFFKKKFFISIQNGWRGRIGDFFQDTYLNKYKKKNLSADYILTFTDAIGDKFKKHINCNNLTIGSFRNNIFKINKFTKKNSIAFISSYKKRDKDYFYNNGNSKILFKDYFISEKIIVNFLSKYCIKNSLELFIIPSQNNKDEHNYYSSVKDNKFNLLPKKNRYCSYEYVDDFEYLVGGDTTLSYESLSRNKRVAFFNIRKDFISKFTNDNLECTDFLWPGKLEQDGPFWTHSSDENSMKRVLDFVVNCNDYEWKSAMDSISKKNYILHDNQNTILKELIYKNLKNNA